MKTEIKITNDGSVTLYVPELNEHYHSVHGAVTESVHVFVNAGLKHCRKKTIRILEVGFGTGLNAILTFMHRKNKHIEYVAIEKYPLDTEMVDKLKYPDYLHLDKHQQEMFYRFHFQSWDSRDKITSDFMLVKINAAIHEAELNGLFDVVYFDAFAPGVQPEMWTMDVFQKIYHCMNLNGILVTYCAKGVVRRTMQSAGYMVERLPGPPGKREMLRAVKIEQ
jgi:tRNA U34 5-methylaminomethyl-2-thiouridine-forming methyltransferase MnmC